MKTLESSQPIRRPTSGMAPPEDGLQEEEEEDHPSIPVLGCRWGLGEGISPAVFKPIPIPPHLLHRQGQPEPTRRTWGRGRAAGLTSHDDPLPSPGRLPSVGVTGLSIGEQISRTDVAIQQEPCNFNDFIIPRSPDEDDPTSAAAPAPHHRLPEMRSSAPRRQPDWAGVLEPYGDVEAVDAAQLPTNMRHAQSAGGGDAGLRALQRLNRSSDSDLDLLEECTNSSDMSNEWGRRSWRPRPPPLTEDSFPPLPGSTTSSSVGGDRRQPEANCSPSWADRSSSGSRAAVQPKPGRGQPKPAGVEAKRDRPRPKPAGNQPKPARVQPEVAGEAGGAQQPKAAGEAAPAAAVVTAPATPPVTGQPAPADEADSKEVRVTGVTDDNWEQIKQFAEQYGTVAGRRRDSDGAGWITMSPPETAEWLLSLQEHTPCDITGVEFALPDGGGT